MASGLTMLFLGCWLTGWSRVSGGGTDPTQPEQTSVPMCLGSARPEGTNLTQPGQMSTSTHPSSTEPGKSESMTTKPPGQSSPTIAGVRAAVIILLLLLLLLVAFVCFRKIRVRRGSALRPNSTNPMVALKAPAQQDPIYTSIDKGKQPQTPPQEPDSGADGLTYAELDGRALQAKRGGLAPAPEPAQTSLYAVINVSQGTLQ
nr:uncharacterized protein LOC116834915 [Chelonoidis abingdonii]